MAANKLRTLNHRQSIWPGKDQPAMTVLLTRDGKERAKDLALNAGVSVSDFIETLIVHFGTRAVPVAQKLRAQMIAERDVQLKRTLGGKT